MQPTFSLLYFLISHRKLKIKHAVIDNIFGFFRKTGFIKCLPFLPSFYIFFSLLAGFKSLAISSSSSHYKLSKKILNDQS